MSTLYQLGLYISLLANENDAFFVFVSDSFSRRSSVDWSVLKNQCQEMRTSSWPHDAHVLTRGSRASQFLKLCHPEGKRCSGKIKAITYERFWAVYDVSRKGHRMHGEPNEGVCVGGLMLAHKVQDKTSFSVPNSLDLSERGGQKTE